VLSVKLEVPAESGSDFLCSWFQSFWIPFSDFRWSGPVSIFPKRAHLCQQE
jgi:hypothetical protein